MYYLAKCLELAGMCIIGSGMIRNFPKLMDPKWLLVGGLFFAAGWVIEKYVLKK
ncbi:MAG: hypothetical protein QGH24_00560 [Candidatus Marinimicrobia bacterium]|jgi:hypothetical protein|nr:hypothetical protein [Candidatus Neomarinimicrobiota bacterium]|tara:strand:+ start:1146 stop:1307 length:162 start_codon:yes stop_codon:yes gene_type:complete